MNISGFQIAQSRNNNTTNNTAFTAIIKTEITRIVAANTTGSAVTFRIFHDDDGTTYDQSTALYYDVSLAANTSTEILSNTLQGGISVNTGGSIGVQNGTANGITFTIYGVTQDIAMRS